MRDAFVSDTLFDVSGEPTDAQKVALKEGAARFLAAGGRLTMADWREMSDASRQAFIDAQGFVTWSVAQLHARAFVEASMNAAKQAATDALASGARPVPKAPVVTTE